MCAFVSAQAQVSVDDLKKEAVSSKSLVPNLSVHFTLNSAIPEEETEYYKEIVQEILRKIPKKVELRGENRSLLSGSNEYDKLRVVSYLPDPENLKDNPTAREIVFFDIDFEKVDDRKLSQLIRKDEELFNPSVFVRTDKLDAFMKKVEAIRAGEEVDALPALDSGSAVENQTISSDILTLPKPEEPKNGAVKPKIDKPLVKEAKSKESKIASVQPKKKNLPEVKSAHQVKMKKVDFNLEYIGDITKARNLDLKNISTFVEAVKKSGRLNIISYTAHTPFQDSSSLFAARLKEIKRVLEENGILWNGLKVTELRMRTQGNQRIELQSGSIKI